MKITKKDIEESIQTLSKEIEKNLVIDYSLCYGGYRIEEIINPHGEIKHFSPERRMTPKETYCFLKGCFTILTLK